MEPELRDYVSYLDAAIAVCAHFGALDSMLVSPLALRDQAGWAIFMNGAMKDTGEPWLLRAPYSAPVPLGELFGMIHLAVLQVRDRSLVLVIAASGTVTECVEHAGCGAAIAVAEGRLRYEMCTIMSDDDESAVTDRQNVLRSALVSAGCKFILEPEAYAALVQSEPAS